MVKVFVILVSIVLSIVSVSSVDIVCPKEQNDVDMVLQFPSSTSCSEFYKCDRGFAVLQFCPDGLHYNTWNQACDYPASARCTIENNETELL